MGISGREQGDLREVTGGFRQRIGGFQGGYKRENRAFQGRIWESQGGNRRIYSRETVKQESNREGMEQFRQGTAGCFRGQPGVMTKKRISGGKQRYRMSGRVGREDRGISGEKQGDFREGKGRFQTGNREKTADFREKWDIRQEKGGISGRKLLDFRQRKGDSSGISIDFRKESVTGRIQGQQLDCQQYWEFKTGQLGENFNSCKVNQRMRGFQWFWAGRVFRDYRNIFGITSGGGQ